jgi:polysaccharide biosynthesis protein PslH
VVVPILSGGGTRLKILEAAACGQAIVSTRLGAEGLPFRDGDHLLIADSPADFAAAVVALLRNTERRAQLGSRARAVAAQFDWVDIGESFTRVIENIVRDRG